MNPSNQRSKSKNSQPNAAQSKQKPTTKQPIQQKIQEVYPIPIMHPELMSPQLKQYITELQRQYIERYNILLNNRIKYDQMVENLAIALDQKGISNHQVAELIKNSNYHHQME